MPVNGTFLMVLHQGIINIIITGGTLNKSAVFLKTISIRYKI